MSTHAQGAASDCVSQWIWSRILCQSALAEAECFSYNHRQPRVPTAVNFTGSITERARLTAVTAWRDRDASKAAKCCAVWLPR